MARCSRTQLLDDFHRLYDCLDAALKAARPIPDFFDIDPDDVLTRTHMLAELKSKKTTASALVAGMRAVLGDICRGLDDLRRRRPTDADRFESRYIALRGTPLPADINSALR